MSTSEYVELRVRLVVRRDNQHVHDAVSLLAAQHETELLDIDYEDAEAPEPELFEDDDGILRPAEWFDAQDWAVVEEMDRRAMLSCDLDGMVPPEAEVFHG